MAANHHSEHAARGKSASSRHGDSHHDHPYRLLLIMAALHFAAMFLLMYLMINTARDIYPNVNQFFMAGTMTAPMVLLELVLMRSMYRRRPFNVALAAAGVALLAACFAAIRYQTGVGDGQFLQSMIPHHSSAILMCQEARISDPEIRALCRSITEGQQQEIDQMRAILQRID
jgi:peptidoglycan/LPS O-acetylase OafA/YrhL